MTVIVRGTATDSVIMTVIVRGTTDSVIMTVIVSEGHPKSV